MASWKVYGSIGQGVRGWRAVRRSSCALTKERGFLPSPADWDFSTAPFGSGFAGLLIAVWKGYRSALVPAAPPVYSELELGRVIQLALTRPKELGKPFRHWSLDTLEEELRREGCLMGRAHIHRVLRAEGVKWQKERTWFASPEPDGNRRRLWSSTSIPRREVT